MISEGTLPARLCGCHGDTKNYSKWGYLLDKLDDDEKVLTKYGVDDA